MIGRQMFFRVSRYYNKSVGTIRWEQSEHVDSALDIYKRQPRYVLGKSSVPQLLAYTRPPSGMRPVNNRRRAAKRIECAEQNCPDQMTSLVIPGQADHAFKPRRQWVSIVLLMFALLNKLRIFRYPYEHRALLISLFYASSKTW